MSHRKSVRGCVAALVFACAVVGTPSVPTQADTVIVTTTVGMRPIGVAINPAGTFAYVVNGGSNTVSKINLATNAVDATITVPQSPSRMTINPAGTFAYFTYENNSNITKIDLETDLLCCGTWMGQDSFGMAINPAGTFAYVTNRSHISKLNLTTGEYATITVGTDPYGVAINPAGTFAYVTNSGTNTVSKIDLANDTVVATIAVGNNPFGVAINPAGTFAYVANRGLGTVSKIDLANDTVVATIAVGNNPFGVAINPAGTFAYVTNRDSNTVSKINLFIDAVVATITVGTDPQDVAINPAGTLAYVTNNKSNTVSRISLTAAEPQSITFSAVSTQLLSDKTVALSASASSNLAVSLTSSTQTVCTVSGSTVTMLKTGDCTINANQAGGSGWDAATEVSRTFAIELATQSITFSAVSTQLLSDKTVALSASASSNLAVSLTSSTQTVCTVSGSTVTMLKTGDCTINANQAGGSGWDAATEVSRTFAIELATQSITFTTIGRAVVPAPLTQLFGAKSVTVVASASSGLAVSFSSSTPTVCTVLASTVTMLKTGDCTINANQAGGSGWDAATEVSRTFAILPSPPAGEVGVSVRNGDAYTNTKQVVLNLVWPEYATAVRISNDGGFGASKTQTKDLAASVDWELDDSVKGIYTKVVYVRFNGVGDTTKTYSDDIILDTTAPTIETSSAAVASSTVSVSLKATDDITGVDKVELKNGSSTVTKDYGANLSVPMKDLGLAVSSASVRKLGTSSIEIRVSDKAGNWSAYNALSVSGVVTTPTVSVPTMTTPTVSIKKAASAKSIAAFAKLKVLSTSKVSLKVVASYAKFCKVSGSSLKGVKAGTCKVTVTVTPKKGKAASKTVTLKVTK
jgi:YVTN family beta-propeller protein